jgi:Spy/CpxP family protein refolding chaperone
MMNSGFIATSARRTLPFLSLLIACSLTASAQPDGPPPGGPPPAAMQANRGPSVERELKQLTQLLTLTVDQQTQVKAILADRHQQVEALFKARQSAQSDADSVPPQPPSQDEMKALRDAMKSIRDASHNKIAALLNADQKTRFAAWQKKSDRSTQQQAEDEMPPPPPDGEGPPDGGGGPGGGGPGGGGPPGA